MPGVENPADIASRGQTPLQLANCKLWFHAPNWLAEPEENWPPVFQPPQKDSPEVAKEVLSACTREEELRAIRAGRLNQWTPALCNVTTAGTPTNLTITKQGLKEPADLFEVYEN